MPAVGWQLAPGGSSVGPALERSYEMAGVVARGHEAPNAPAVSDSSLEKRKDAHLDIVLGEAVVPGTPAVGLGRFTLEYDALPELDLEEVDLSVSLLGKRLKAPILVGAMTGGTGRAREVNHRLARAAARVGVGMCLGSQRAMIVKPELAETFDVRSVAPELPLLIGNVGAVQLNYGVDLPMVERALHAVAADAVNLHLNPLQEAVQPEGDTRFSSLLPKIADLATALSVPVLLKEVGGGISARTAKKAAALPIAGLEAAGTGGTSWAKVESFRAPAQSAQAEVGRRLEAFGITTAESIPICRAALGPDRVVVGSGGVRTGMDAAVALALGADAVALARPLLQAAVVSEEAVVRELETLIFELRVLCFCTGSRTPGDLRDGRLRAI